MDKLGLFTLALGSSGPWRVIRTEFDAEAAQLDLYLACDRQVWVSNSSSTAVTCGIARRLWGFKSRSPELSSSFTPRVRTR